MSIFKTEDCPICGNKTNAFQKTMARYNGKFICRSCYPKIIKAGVNVWEIKKKTLAELQQLIGDIQVSIDMQQNLTSENMEIIETKIAKKPADNSIAEQIKNGKSYHLEDTSTSIDFYEHYLEYTEKRYSNTKWKLDYDTEKLYAFQLKEVSYEITDYHNAVYIRYLPYSGALIPKTLIVYVDKRELKNIQKLISYLNEKIAVKYQYDKIEKTREELRELERVYGKYRYSINQFAFLDEDHYLKESAYDVELENVKACNFDISTVKIEEALYFEFEPNNLNDKHAIKVIYHNQCIGYIPQNNLQSMMKAYYEDPNGQVRGFIQRVNEHNKEIQIGLGFYKQLTKEELKKVPHMDVSLIKTSKKDFMGTSRQEHLDCVSEGDEVYLEYDYETETYLVTDDCANELGEISKSKSQKLQEYEDEGKTFYGVILETDYSDSGKNTCEIRIFIKEE
ncbi:MAG: DUF4428 domain-containing protein [Cellulosilyticum sp.]|nr:DUF4428 domain-containing protein [Cellulosilyticum sp.]